MPGLSIAVEGLDGTGKSTLARELAAAMGAEHLSTPGAHLSDVRRQLEETYAGSPVALQLFYASSVVAASDRIAALTAAGTDVVVDRYWLSTVVNAPLRGDFVDLSQLARRLRPVDLTVVVEVDEPVRRARLLSRGMTAHDRQTLDPAVARSLRAGYRRGLLLPVSGHPVLVDGTNSTAAELVARVLATVDRVEAGKVAGALKGAGCQERERLASI